MIITINADNKVISKAVGKIFDNTLVDNKTTFRVGVVESVDENGETVLTSEVMEPVFDHDTEELYFNPETREFYTQPKPVTLKPSEEELKILKEARENKQKALKWLADNDWKPNKIIRKEWAEDDPRWIEYLEGCTAARATIDEAELILIGRTANKQNS